VGELEDGAEDRLRWKLGAERETRDAVERRPSAARKFSILTAIRLEQPLKEPGAIGSRPRTRRRTGESGVRCLARLHEGRDCCLGRSGLEVIETAKYPEIADNFAAAKADDLTPLGSAGNFRREVGVLRPCTMV